MQAHQPQPIRPHWIPVEPSWIVSIALILLAVLPHQVPLVCRRALRTSIGSLMFATLSAYVTWVKPVLGLAMFLFLGGVVFTMNSEPFAATNLNKDVVKRKANRWYEEEVMSEDPHGIQERTENPTMSYDEVDSEPWHAERVLHEHPEAIQEKAVGTVPEYDEGGSSFGHR